jgi:hypothetical protein
MQVEREIWRTNLNAVVEGTIKNRQAPFSFQQSLGAVGRMRK